MRRASEEAGTPGDKKFRVESLEAVEPGFSRILDEPHLEEDRQGVNLSCTGKERRDALEEEVLAQKSADYDQIVDKRSAHMQDVVTASSTSNDLSTTSSATSASTRPHQWSIEPNLDNGNVVHTEDCRDFMAVPNAAGHVFLGVDASGRCRPDTPYHSSVGSANQTSSYQTPYLSHCYPHSGLGAGNLNVGVNFNGGPDSTVRFGPYTENLTPAWSNSIPELNLLDTSFLLGSYPNHNVGNLGFRNLNHIE
ncbi:MAG: hypothetical protein Q9162_007828 [Coniocarpon cinnabarinum]